MTGHPASGARGRQRQETAPSSGVAPPAVLSTTTHADRPDTTATGSGPSGRLGRRLRALWNTALGGIGTIVGLAPHVLHHIGLLAGTALLAGTGGTVVFGIVGFAASIPLLLRLRRRFGSWWAPVIGLVVFVAMFALSAFVVGPAISGNGSDTPGGNQPSPTVDHTSHH